MSGTHPPTGTAPSVVRATVREVTTDNTPAHFIRDFLDTYERHDLDTLWTIYSPKCSFPVLERFGIEPSLDNYKGFMATFIDAFPDVHHTIENLLSDGDRIWALYTMTGTHRGLLRGVPGTGKQVRYPIVAMYRVADGLITEADFVSDDLRMMRQIGALPS
jgi:steroid delta-isomerase-like uncharacterized protein